MANDTTATNCSATSLIQSLQQKHVQENGLKTEDLAALDQISRHVNVAAEVLLTAILRVEMANAEGDPILSAWLPDAREALAKLADPASIIKF